MGKLLNLCAAGLMSIFVRPAAYASEKTAEQPPTAAELVQAVRQSENWIHDVNSFYARFESTWVRTPEWIEAQRAKLKKQFPGQVLDPNKFPDLRPQTQHRFEIAFDKKRLHYLRDEPGESFSLYVWDGKLAAYHENHIRYSQEQFGLANEPSEIFRDFPNDLAWLWVEPHCFWWRHIDVDSELDYFGRPEHFKMVGRETFQGTDCHVLEYETRGGSAGWTLRWYAGAKDHLLHGDMRLRDGQIDDRHWLTDYRQVAPGCWFPMGEACATYERDESGRTYMTARQDSRAVEVHVNEPLPDELFKLELREGVEVADMRFGGTRVYRYAPEVPDLVGKSIPGFDGIQLDCEPNALKDKPLLVCFWDPDQRPSRHCLRRLAEQAPLLVKWGVVLVAIQSAKTAPQAPVPWSADLHDYCRTGTIQGDSSQIQFTWGVRSLPWLILADRQHIVVAEGISLEELARKIAADAGNPRDTGPARDATEPNATDLVREVRASEDWLHRIDSLRFRVEGKWSHPPESIAARRAELRKQDPNREPDPQRDASLRPTATDSLEYAIDSVKQRLRYVQNTPTEDHFLQIWDGQQLVCYAKHADGYEQYSLNLSKESLDRIFGSLSWPRARPHSFWWAPEDVEGQMRFFGRPQDFRSAGRADYRGVSCYVLEFDPPETPGQTVRWYVGRKDHLLYGRASRFGEHWTLDYRQVAPQCWMPLIQGYTIWRYDPQRKEYYLGAQRDVRIVGVRVNEALRETLFQMEWKEGIDVADRRSGETVWSKYVAVLPSLVGQPLPDLATLGIDPARERIAGRSMLLCFCDMNQRPSRHGLAALAPQAEKLKKRGVVVLILQTVESEETAWAQPAGESELPWPVQTVKGDARKTRLTWGIRSLPWLILTDNRHIVTAEGFAVNELADKLQGLENSK
jgi:hypothetical protein